MDTTDISRQSLDTICATLCHAMGITPPEHAAGKHLELTRYLDNALSGEKADRIFMYNPDAIAQWIYEKYPMLFETAEVHAELKLPLQSVVPPKTPVCFATMYTGAQPAVHGIQKYEKPVLQIDTIFDALIRAGKKPVIVAYGDCSISRIFLEREMDYFIFDTVEQVNAKAAELILRDEHDFYVVYNGDFDGYMHVDGPEGVRSLGALCSNCSAYATFSEMIAEHWKEHNTLTAFAMDHGCHYKETTPGGTHGKDIPEDMEIVHFYKAFKKSE